MEAFVKTIHADCQKIPRCQNNCLVRCKVIWYTLLSFMYKSGKAGCMKAQEESVKAAGPAKKRDNYEKIIL